MLVSSTDIITKMVLLGVRCPFHPLTPLGESIQNVQNIYDESNIIVRPTICVHSKVKIGNSIICIHTHLNDLSYHSDETCAEVPVTQLTDSKLDDEDICFTDLTNLNSG